MRRASSVSLFKVLHIRRNLIIQVIFRRKRVKLTAANLKSPTFKQKQRRRRNNRELKHEEELRNLSSCGDLAAMSSWPSPLLSLSTGSGGDRNQSDETDADIRWRIRLQLVSPELPLTAVAL